jgi:hypothetical protein
MLLWRGSSFWLRCLEDSRSSAILIAVGAVAVGGAKGWFVLRKSSKRMIARIGKRPGPRPVWETYPVYFYPLIGAMIGMGIGVRALWADDSPGIVALVYLGIGTALLTSAPPFFGAARSFGSPGDAAPESAA